MGKKILIGVTILLITGLLAGWYYFTREAKYFGTSSFRAVPEKVSVIVRIHHLENYTSRSITNPIWQAYSGFPGVSSLYQQLSFADSLFKTYPAVENSFSDKDLTVMIGGTNDNFQTLFLVELSGLTEKRVLTEFVENLFSLKGAVAKKAKAGGADITGFSWKQGELLRNYYVAFYRGLFFASADSGIIAQAVRQLESSATQGNTFLEKANKTATDNIDLNIYLNHKELPQFANLFFSGVFCERLLGSSQLAEWSEIDLTQKNGELLFNGFSFTGDSLNQYLGIFLHQKPDTFNLAAVFPSQTSFFMSYLISNNLQFFNDYENLLDHKNGLEEYKNSLREVNSLYGLDIRKMVVDNLDGAAAMVFTRPDSASHDENKYLVLKVGSGSKMETEMIPLTLPAGNTGKHDLSNKASYYRIDNETVFKIYKTPVNDFGKRVFGDVFSDVVTSYYTFYDNCLIMGASYESICRFVRANVIQETLGNDPAYHAFTKGLSNRLNFYLWCSPARSLPFFRETLNTVLYRSLNDQLSDFQRIESVGWQIGIENGIVYNMACLKYNPDVHQSQTSVAWKSHLGSLVINQPQFVINPSDKTHREIIVQDGDHNFILISNEGRVLWKIKLKGPIRSEVFQLDCFRDGNLQFFFSTDDALHMIGHDGNYIRNYPLVLRSPATNGVSVVDYDRNSDYRFFIAGKDHHVYLYDKKGKVISGWTPQKTEHDVTQPVQFFRVENKDYIVFFDKTRGYILDRKGKTRVVIKGDISYSHNRFALELGLGKRPPHLVTTDNKGNIVSIGFDGSVRKFSVGTFSPDHYFVYDDFNSDNKRDYIFLDGDSLSVYDQRANRIFTRKFGHKIDSPPGIYSFPDRSRKIGVADTTENQIYLFNPDGSVCKGFPLEGNSRFILGFPGHETDPFNLITGTPGGFLSNYELLNN